VKPPSGRAKVDFAVKPHSFWGMKPHTDIPVVIGDRLAYSDVGAGPPLVFLHGYGGNRVTWMPWLDTLARDYRCIVVDMTGFGVAPRPAGADVSLVGLANAVVDLIERLDLTDVSLVGHSLGGGVAMLTALTLHDSDRPENRSRVRRVVSVAGATYPQRPPPFVRLTQNRAVAEFMFRVIPKQALIWAIYRTVVSRPEAATLERITAYAEPFKRAVTQKTAIDVAQQIIPPDAEQRVARYAELGIPVLCLWGRDDRIVPLWVGQRLAAEMPGGRFVVLERCGHMPTEEAPAESLEIMLEFLRSTAHSPAHPVRTPDSEASAAADIF